MAISTSSGNRYTVDKTYSGLQAFSVSLWARPTSTTGGAFAARWEDVGAAQQWIMEFNGSNWTVLFSIRDSGYRTATTAINALTQNVWAHLALVYSSQSGDSFVRVFINGVQAAFASAAIGSSLFGQTTPFGIGGRHAGNGEFVGDLAELATFTRRLRESEVIALSKGLSPGRFRPDCYIPFIRSVEDRRSNYQITTVGSPGASAHPRIYI